MFEFDIDNSSYFDFATENRMDFVIKQNSELPILEIKPIKTRNFNELLSLIENSYVLFSMFDETGCAVILNQDAVINLDTPENEYNKLDNTCKEINNFTLQYFFTKFQTQTTGVFKGEFKIVFNKDGNEKTLIVPINNNLNIQIIPSKIK